MNPIAQVWLSPTVGLIWRHEESEDLTTMHGYEPIGVALLPDDAVGLTPNDEYGDPHLVETLHETVVRLGSSTRRPARYTITDSNPVTSMKELIARITVRGEGCPACGDSAGPCELGCADPDCLSRDCESHDACEAIDP